MGYLSNFIVYTLAMAGVMAMALLIFKNATGAGAHGKAKHMKVLDTLSLTPRKTLYIVSAGSEKFLIAGDTDRTTLISKLETQDAKVSVPVCSEPVLKNDYMDKSVIGIHKETSYSSVMKNLAQKMKGVNDSGLNKTSMQEVYRGVNDSSLNKTSMQEVYSGVNNSGWNRSSITEILEGAKYE